MASAQFLSNSPMPFEPIPSSLGVNSIHIRAPFVANNFVVK